MKPKNFEFLLEKLGKININNCIIQILLNTRGFFLLFYFMKECFLVLN